MVHVAGAAPAAFRVSGGRSTVELHVRDPHCFPDGQRI